MSVSSALSLRWVAVGVFVASSTLNYLDRQLLATLAPLIMAELHFNQQGYGLLIAAFSVAYAASSLVAGWFLDRTGVNRGIVTAVAWWSTAAAGMGLARSAGSLALCRAALGVGESAGVPAVGKLNGYYLKPEERALGAAVNQIGLSLGLALAPLWIGLAASHGWRYPFVVAGLLGFAWIPLWRMTNRAIPPAHEAKEFAAPERRTDWAMLLDRRLLIVVAASALWMGSYSLWSNWTTLYLTKVHHLTLAQSAGYVWIPPLVSNLGGFFGGWLSLLWMRQGVSAIAARRRVVWVSVFGSMLTLLLPIAPGPVAATVLISISFFFALSGSVNIYALPIDLFGASRSGLSIAALTCAFGVLQTAISPIIGYLGDHNLYNRVVWMTTLCLVLSAFTLQGLTPLDRQPMR